MRALTVISLLFLLVEAKAQDQTAFYDSLTLSDYYMANWKALLKDGRNAAASNSANIYTLKRMGYAAHRLKRYHSSNWWYQKAAIIDAKDPDVLTMLYANHLELGNSQERYQAQKGMSFELQQYLGLRKIPVLDYGFAEFCAAPNNNEKRNGNLQKSQFNAARPATRFSQFLNEPIYYWSAGLNFNLKKKGQLLFQYSGFSSAIVQREQLLGLRQTGTIKVDGNNEPVYLRVDSSLTNKYHLQQHQFYLALKLLTKNNTLVVPYLHGMLNFSSPFVVNATSAELHVQPNPASLTTVPVFEINKPAQVSGGLTLGILAGRQLRQLWIDGNLSYTYFNTRSFVQATLGVAWSPFGNLKLVVAPRFSYVYVAGESRAIASLQVSSQLHRLVYISASGGYGDRSNTTEAAGSLNFFGADHMAWFAGASLYIPVLKNLHVYTSYQFRAMQSENLLYIRPDIFGKVTTNYNTHLISIGLKFLL
ncbi:MAG: hypothetical protein U0T73_10535 [Chitinophagales bacterium]